MLILIVEGLTCICSINYLLAQIMMLWTTSASLTAASANIIFVLNVCVKSHHENSLCPSNVSLLSLLLSHHSQIKVLDGEDEYYKLLSTVESIPEEEYATAPPSALSSGPLVSQS